VAGEAGRSSTARNGSRLLTAKHVRRASGYYRALAPLLGILDEKNAGFFVLELVYARNAFYPEDWFLAVYPWSAPPFINFAVTRLDSAEPGLDAAQIGCLIGEKRRMRADGISGSPLLPPALARSRASPGLCRSPTKSP